MIQPSNNAMSFKGFYTNKNSKFSESQNKVVQDIKTKLKDESHKHDFFLNQGKYKDSISLTEVYNLKDVGRGVDKHQTYNGKLEIGTYDEEHPFNLKDLKNARRDDIINTFCLGIIAISILALSILSAKLGKQPSNRIPESVNKTSIMKDTIASDSPKILKDAFVVIKELNRYCTKYNLKGG